MREEGKAKRYKWDYEPYMDIFTALTDCGAGGYSSAVGEMGELTGAEVHLENIPLKYPGLSSYEKWISESQERMVATVPKEHLDKIDKIIEYLDYHTLFIELTAKTLKEKSYSLDYNFTMNNAGEAKIKFVVTDKEGEKSEISLTIISEESTTDLGASTDVFWERIGGNAATGLTEFGLKWENNLKETHAVIEKDGASKLVKLTKEEWTTITTVEDLKEAIEAGTDLTDYRGISTTTPGNYEEVIATEFNGEYFIINLSNTTIETGTNGTTVKIFGQAKK